MSDNNAKIKLRIGQLEVEYEGHDSFLKEDIFHLMERAIELHAKHDQTVPIDPPQDNALHDNGDDESANSVGHSRRWELSVSTIATRLGAKTGPDLAFAAAAYLAMVQEKERFSRKDIHDTMKTDSGVYKRSMSKNLTAALQSLVKSGKVNETAKGSYALSAAGKEHVESSLGNNT